MKTRNIIALTVVIVTTIIASRSDAQPVPPHWRPPTCATNDFLKFNGTTWGCSAGGSISGSGTTDRVAKWTSSSTLGDTAFPIDDSATVLSLGDSGLDSVDVNADLIKFGGTGDGSLYISNSSFNYSYATNGESTGYVNSLGYLGGTTQFRNFIIGDGKGATGCEFTGSTKTLNCVGGLQINGVSVTTSASVSGTPNTIAKFTGANAVGDSSITDNGTIVTTSLTTYVGVDTGTGAKLLNVGRDTTLTTNGRNGFAIQTYSDGNNYIDSKTWSGGSTYYRAGAGAEAGDGRTWLTVTNSSAAAAFAGNVTLGDADADTHTLRGVPTVKKTGADSAADLYFENDAANWRVGVDGSNSDRFHITETGVGIWAAIAKTTGAATFYGSLSTDGNLTAGNAAASDTHAINGTTTITGTSSVQPLHVVGREGATSGIVARFASNTSGSPTMLQVSDGVTYNWGIGAASSTSFVIRTGTFAGSAGTTLCSLSSGGAFDCSGGFSVGGIAVLKSSDIGTYIAGTSGKSARFTSTNVIGDGAFTDDGTNASIAGKLTATGATQLTERIRFAGQEFFQAAHTDTDGPTFGLWINRSANKQVFLADSSALTVNSTNRLLTMGASVNSGTFIDSVATDGTTKKSLLINPTGGNVGIGISSTPAGLLSVISSDITAPGSVTTWGGAESVFGPNAGSTTGAALGLGYSTTAAASVIMSLQPGTAWKPLNFYTGGINFYANNGAESGSFSSAGVFNVGGAGDTRSLDIDSGGTLTTRFDDNSLARNVLINNRGITAAGNGAGIVFSLAAGAATAVGAVSLDAISENTTHTGATADGTFSLKTALDGTLVERLRCDSTGLCNMPGNTTLGDAAGDVLDVNGDESKFGSTDGAVFFSTSTIGFAYSTNATSTGYINWRGYQAGTTQFRDLVLGDGKEVAACTLTGSTKILNCVGGLQVNGSNVAVASAVSGTTNTIAKFTSGSAVGNSSITDNGSGAITITGSTDLTVDLINSARTWRWWSDNSPDNLILRDVTSSTDMATFTSATAIFNKNVTLGDADADSVKSTGTFGFGGTNPSINTCGTSPSISGEAQSFQLTVGSGVTSCVVNLNRTFAVAPYCNFSPANDQASGDVAAAGGNGDSPYITSSTTTVTMTFDANTESSPIYNVTCFDRP